MTQQWWRDAVIYQVYVRSFADSTGNGIGDLPGVRARLGHIASLGVDALWLTPFYPSPQADGGYDVADYRDVDPLFGTLADMEGLIADAHAAGLRVLVDVVPNHTSDQHPWFAAALAEGPGCAARERYVFRDGRGPNGERPPNDWESVFGGPAWTRVADGQWYLHLFDAAQPDLNWENPEVRAEFEDVLRFWLDRGVDGFRIDVAHGLVKAPGLPDVGRPRQIELEGVAPLPYFDQDGVHEIYRSWRKILDSYPGGRIGVAEAWVPNAHRRALYLRRDELHQAFNFHYVKAGWSAADFRRVVDESLAAVAEVDAPSTWVLSNHDIERHVTRFGGGEVGLRRARAAALLTFALPGSVYVYQGEELGLPEVTDLPDEVLVDPKWERSGRTDRGRDGCRVPLPWSGEAPPFGFTTGPSTWLPQPASWAGVTAEAQEADPDSTLALYRAALRLRRGLGPRGELRWRDLGPDLLVFERGPGFVCVVNFGSSAVPVPVAGELVLTSAPRSEFAVAGDHVTMPPDSAAWWTTAAPESTA
ncbi:alpha-glucosidase [Amycolatopsis arida]|uniref:Alpha-glucosidase n=1 Tax=Amycolatopsis arida TaxID=587909 RepID=A0A1I5THV1_9PSEU|nr:glycoside hydrolase family 13 protein [Amycolatopsis arida]TDX96091.1 alpha-glucosidase [Amycolatopsis arida]SFP82498.1 alpha-glucosidase [Amycolatopsis arida]